MSQHDELWQDQTLAIRQGVPRSNFREHSPRQVLFSIALSRRQVALPAAKKVIFIRASVIRLSMLSSGGSQPLKVVRPA